jgi:hypothetical protein
VSVSVWSFFNLNAPVRGCYSSRDRNEAFSSDIRDGEASLDCP